MIPATPIFITKPIPWYQRLQFLSPNPSQSGIQLKFLGQLQFSIKCMSSATFSVWFNPILGFLCTRGFYRKFPQGGLKKFSKLILKKFSIFWPSFEKILHIFPIFAKYNLSLVAHFLRATPPFWGFSAHAKYNLSLVAHLLRATTPFWGFSAHAKYNLSLVAHLLRATTPFWGFSAHAKYNLSLVAHLLRATTPFWGFSAHAKYKLVVCCTSFLCYHPISGFLCTCQIKFSSLWHISCVLPPHAKYNFSMFPVGFIPFWDLSFCVNFSAGHPFLG